MRKAVCTVPSIQGVCRSAALASVLPATSTLAGEAPRSCIQVRPEPLGWGDAGQHGVAVIDVGPESIDFELIETASRRYEHHELDCTGAAASAVVAEQLAGALAGLPEPDRLCLRIDLVGEVEPDCEIRVAELAEPLSESLAALVLRDRTRPAYDLDSLARQHTAQGRFVRRLTERIQRATSAEERETLELALLAGLRALDGRRDSPDANRARGCSRVQAPHRSVGDESFPHRCDRAERGGQEHPCRSSWSGPCLLLQARASAYRWCLRTGPVPSLEWCVVTRANARLKDTRQDRDLTVEWDFEAHTVIVRNARHRGGPVRSGVG